jgi:hypothetical protein|tara:strand:- start:185 stop:376 length:192 start_codon:yes stop_codon:yes gene_type:complete
LVIKGAYLTLAFLPKKFLDLSADQKMEENRTLFAAQASHLMNYGSKTDYSQFIIALVIMLAVA